jgi:hypothetical protein
MCVWGGVGRGDASKGWVGGWVTSGKVRTGAGQAECMARVVQVVWCLPHTGSVLLAAVSILVQSTPP